MVRKIFKTGNSMVVALPKEMLDALRAGEGTEVSVELDASGGRIVLAPVQPAVQGVDADFARQLAEFINTYRPALDALAK